MSVSPIWAVVPAAGVGRRMGAEMPKQYLPLAGRTVLEHTLLRLLSIPEVSGIIVAVAADDARWDELQRRLGEARIESVAGGAQRHESVANALDALATRLDSREWVLVHDAARPCVRASDIEHLIRSLRGDPCGGLLGVPVRDTMKRSNDEARVIATEPRERLWHALTPQMYRLGPLRQALSAAVRDGYMVTDETFAMERAGYQPTLIEGHADNLKITRMEDLDLAQFYMTRQLEAGA